MSTARLVRVASLLVPLAAAACTQANPWFLLAGEDETGADSGAGPGSTTSGEGPGSSSTGEGEGAGEASTAAVLTTWGDATSDVSTSGGSTGSESGSN